MNDEDTAFAKLTQSELTLVGTLGAQVDFSDREILFRAGEAKIDLFVVLEGSVDIVNPADANRLVVTHDPGSFIGDIDLLTGRPVLVTAIARGKAKTIRVPSTIFDRFSIVCQVLAKSSLLDLLDVGKSSLKRVRLASRSLDQGTAGNESSS